MARRVGGRPGALQDAGANACDLRVREASGVRRVYRRFCTQVTPAN